MAVQVGRTVISFTIKYVQSEREKIKNDISKVLDAKKGIVKAAIKPPPENFGQNPPLGGTGTNFNNNDPLHMQNTQYAQLA